MPPQGYSQRPRHPIPHLSLPGASGCLQSQRGDSGTAHRIARPVLEAPQRRKARGSTPPEALTWSRGLCTPWEGDERRRLSSKMALRSRHSPSVFEQCAYATVNGKLGPFIMKSCASIIFRRSWFLLCNKMLLGHMANWDKWTGHLSHSAKKIQNYALTKS